MRREHAAAAAAVVVDEYAVEVVERTTTSVAENYNNYRTSPSTILSKRQKQQQQQQQQPQPQQQHSNLSLPMPTAGVPPAVAAEKEETMVMTEQRDSSAGNDQGLEALWIEETNSPDGSSSVGGTPVSVQPTSRSFFGRKKNNKLPPSPSRRRKKDKHHAILLLDNDNNNGDEVEAAVPAEERTEREPPQEAAVAERQEEAEEEKESSSLGKETPEWRAATKVLMARKLLDSAYKEPAYGRFAFLKAVEARKLVDTESNEDPIMSQLLKDATAKGEEAVQNQKHERAKDLLEFIMPVLPEEVLQQAAIPMKSVDCLPEIDTNISSLGFDKSFDEYAYKSPKQFDVLSMSSLNEILDGPLTPPLPGTVPACDDSSKDIEVQYDESLAVLKKDKNKKLFGGMFNKKKKNANSDESSPHQKKKIKSPSLPRSPMRRKSRGKKKGYDTTVVVNDGVSQASPPVDEEEEEEDREAALADAQFSNLLAQAMDHDDTCSLKSLDGVVQHSEPDEKEKKKSKKKKKSAAATTGKPKDWETSKPTFVSAPPSSPAILVAKSWESTGANEDDDAQAAREVVQNLASFSPPVDDDDDDDGGDHDRYRVLVEEEEQATDQKTTDSDWSESDGKTAEDKYTVFSNPCSLCDSLFGGASRQVASELPSSPTEDLDKKLTTDKYTELPEVALVNSSSASTSKESIAVVEEEQSHHSRRSFLFVRNGSNASSKTSLFGKFRKKKGDESKEKKSDSTEKNSSSLSVDRPVKKHTMSLMRLSPRRAAAKAATTPPKSILKKKSSKKTMTTAVETEQPPPSNEVKQQDDEQNNENDDPLLDHIKQQAQKQQLEAPRGRDPVTAASPEHLQLDP